MNMFSAIQQVDEHVKRLLNISKNADDIDLQSLTIAKLYFDINEYAIAKSYIERYMKAKSNSESGLVLKAKIHEKLKEDNHALHCYESLYNIYNKKSYIEKACHCLLQFDAGDQKAKTWIDILESVDPENNLLIDLKIRFFGTLDASSKELDNLENKMKNDTNNQIKRQYLAILERLQVTDNVLAKCVDMLNNYAVLDDTNIVKTCVKIFERANANVKENCHEPLYCILLIALLKNRMKSCDYDCSQYLLKLYNLLKVDRSGGTFIELKSQFMYHLISYTHGLVNKSMTSDIAFSLYRCYSCLKTSDKPIQDGKLSTNIFTWLMRQYKYRCSLVNHMIANVDEKWAHKKCTITECILTITNITWPSNSDNYEDLEKMFGENKKNDVSKMIESDIECHSDQKMDFSLIIWQLMGYLDVLRSDHSDELNITSRATTFVTSLLSAAFPKLPMHTLHNRCPENICKSDLITFLLGSVLTYQKSTKTFATSLPFPYEYMVANVRVIDTVDKWWQTVCDFLLNNKRNTSIGVMRDFFKKGLEIVQVVDCKLSESLKLQLGRYLAKFANESVISETDTESLLERSIGFLQSVINENGTIPLKSIPITSFNSQTSLVIRQNNYQNSPFNKNQNIVLFDTEDLSKEMLEKWRCEAYLSYIDWKLKRDNLEDERCLYDLHDLIDTVESMEHNNPNLYLVKSRMYLAHARKSIESNESDMLPEILLKAKDCVEKSREYLNTLKKIDRDELDLMLNDQMAAIDLLKCSDSTSLLGFTCSDESSNNADMQFAETRLIDLSTQNATNSFKDSFSNIKTENDIEFIESINEKVHQSISLCLDKVEESGYMSQTHTHDIELLKSQSERHDDLYSDLIAKFETLNRKLHTFTTIEENCEQITSENQYLKEKMKGLLATVGELENRNLSLEMKFDNLQLTSTLQSHMNTFTQSIGSKLTNTQAKIQGHFSHFDKIESQLINAQLGKQRQMSNVKQFARQTQKEVLKTGTVAIDSSKTGKKTNETMPKVTTSNGFDLSHLTLNKWQCPICLNNNDDCMAKCPSCETVNPNDPKNKTDKATNDNVQKIPFGAPSVMQTNKGFNLSHLTLNKWQCLTCLNSNEDSMAKCPSCETVNPNGPKNKTDKATNDNVNGTKNKNKTEMLTKVPTTNISFGSNSKPILFPIETVTGNLSNTGFDLTRFTLNKWQCPTCNNSNDDSMPSCPSCNTFNPKNSKPLVVLGQKIVFGSNSSQNVNGQNEVKNNFGKECLDFKFGTNSALPLTANDYWRCECTTKNQKDESVCVACGELRDKCDSDSDVIITSEPYVTKEQIARARLLKLPDHFYYYENLPDNGSSDSEDEERPKAVIEEKGTTQVNINAADTTEEAGDDIVEDFDPHYQPIIELAAIELKTGEEGWTSVYSHRAKLFRFMNNGWVERGLGDMKIMSRIGDNGKVSARLIMRREQVQRVCCSHAIMKNCPSFSPMATSNTMTCWFANDFSEGSEPIKENFAIRFKNENELNEFKAKVAELQREME